MTATTRKYITLHCDKPGLDCPAVFKGQPNELRSEVRRRAAREFGWALVKSELGPHYDDDFCKEHAP